jgi:hypothetical protein
VTPLADETAVGGIDGDSSIESHDSGDEDHEERGGFGGDEDEDEDVDADGDVEIDEEADPEDGEEEGEIEEGAFEFIPFEFLFNFNSACNVGIAIGRKGGKGM